MYVIYAFMCYISRLFNYLLTYVPRTSDVY